MTKFQPGNNASQGKEAAVRRLRTKLCKPALEDLSADWQEGGAAAIKMMRIERPAEYVRSDVLDLPKEMLFETGAVTELDDDELDRMIDVASPWLLRSRSRSKAPELKLLNGKH